MDFVVLGQVIGYNHPILQAPPFRGTEVHGGLPLHPKVCLAVVLSVWTVPKSTGEPYDVKDRRHRPLV